MNIVKTLDYRIFALEMQSREINKLNETYLQLSIKKKSDRIVKSDSRVQDLDTILAIQKNKSITNNDPEPVVESNRKNDSVKRNLIRQDAFQNPISFFYNHFIKIQASPQLFLTYVCFP